jgi:apurinic endonuclease APN1
MGKDYYYGSHINSPDGIIDGIDKIIKYGGNFIQIFITDPQSRFVTKISDNDLLSIKNYAELNKVKIVIHAPYTLNFAREFKKKSKRNSSLIYHLDVCAKLNALGVVIHTGKFVDMDKNDAIENMYKNIKFGLDNSNKNAKILLETPCGQGSELGGKLEEFRFIYNKFSEDDKKRLRICVDTCHVFAAGYDLTTPNKVKEFIKLYDTIIGWKYVDLIHLNDSKTILNSNRDRHASLGDGYIGLHGLSTFVKFVYNASIPIILETPIYSDDVKRFGGHLTEIKLIKKLIN